MAYYPKIATFYYKDRNIDIRLCIRAKLVQLKKYKCPKCKGIGTISQLISFFENKHQNDLLMMKNRYIPKFGKKMIPEKLLSGDQILCPNCEKIMMPFDKEILKFYVCSNPEFISLGEMLNRHTSLRWNKDFHGNLCCFPKDFDNGIKCLIHANTKNKKSRIRINRKVDMSLIKNELKEYTKRKAIDML